MKILLHRLLFLIGFILFNSHVTEAQTASNPRTIITTDGEIDDVDSFIRMLLYANEFNIEGLVYSSSMWHYKGDGKGTPFTSEMEMTKNIYGEITDLRWPGTQWMQELIGGYEKIYPNLIKHADGYPTAEYLKSLIKVGNIDFEGSMARDTDGSNFIKEKLLDDDLTPIYLQVWGGTNTIARALLSIENTYKDTPEWGAIYEKVSKKAIIYAILDQDATYRKYISKNWPDVKVFYNANQFWCFAYPWKASVHEDLHSYLEGGFMGEHIINNHGPLMKMYYSYGDGQKQEGDDEHVHGDITKIKGTRNGDFNKYDFISEGDSPAFLHLVNVGLDNLDNPHYGGWGGRLQQSETNPNRWEDGEAVADFNPLSNKVDLAYPQIRWLKTLQLDFAARADWCMESYENANHTPTVSLKHANVLKVEAGKKVTLKGKASDPDGDKLSYSWWQYKEVGSYKGDVSILKPTKCKTKVQVPVDLKKGETIHLILEVSDSHLHSMTRYQRVVLEGK